MDAKSGNPIAYIKNKDDIIDTDVSFLDATENIKIINIYDINGKVILQSDKKEISSNEDMKSLLSTLKKGMYTVVIITNKQIYVQKLYN